MSNPVVWQFSLNPSHAAIWGGSLLVALILFSRFVSPRALAIATLLATVALVMLGAYVRDATESFHPATPRTRSRPRKWQRRVVPYRCRKRGARWPIATLRPLWA